MRVLIFVLLVCRVLPAAEFVKHVIAEDLKGAYQVVAVDLNRDGKPDLLAVASGMTELVWFENPGWQRHVMATGLRQVINAAAYDVDGDGVPEIAVAYEFSNSPAKSAGVVAILQHGPDPMQPWAVREIDRIPSSHRLRWADIDGSGKKVLVNAPLAGVRGDAPDYRDGVSVVYYRPGEWKREVMTDQEQGVLHGIFVTRWTGERRESVVTASFLGIHRHEWRKGHWVRSALAEGNAKPWPKSGSSDVTVGSVGKQRFLAAIEPWHGEQVAVYQQRRGKWVRSVIDDSLMDGHTILAADFDGHGQDTIVAGFRGGTRGVHVYAFAGGNWLRSVLETGTAAAGCAVADLNGDGRPDVACMGGTTLRWFENKAARTVH